MSEITFTKIMVEYNGEIVNIVDLPREEYEHFLKLMSALNGLYKLIPKQ